jgi:hypothetical protein
MSALCQKQTFGLRNAMSNLPPKADIAQRGGNVRVGLNNAFFGVLVSIRCKLAGGRRYLAVADFSLGLQSRGWLPFGSRRSADEREMAF